MQIQTQLLTKPLILLLATIIIKPIQIKEPIKIYLK
jgi:hypothetical protein